MYKVDPKTLLFTNLDNDREEAHELYLFCRRIVLEGHTNLQHPAFRAWSNAAEYDERQALLVYATAFPQRALLSLLDVASLAPR